RIPELSPLEEPTSKFFRGSTKSPCSGGLFSSLNPCLFFSPRYFFPRQLLIRYFWTPNQRVEFLDAYDAIRRGSYPRVVESIALAACRQRVLCLFQVQRGGQPRVAELYAVRNVFSGPPLALNKLQVAHVKALSRVLFLTPHLPAFLLRHRLRNHVLEIRHLDRALLRLGLGQLSEEELKAVRTPPHPPQSLLGGHIPSPPDPHCRWILEKHFLSPGGWRR
uniref:LETM1 domain containing 1 n=1 Tax=Calidris pygmaea TaxID=425635 RepID=A0A8C3K3D5_9CHAR